MTTDAMGPYTHKDGVPWDKAPIPPARHRCKAQSWAKITGPAGLGFMCRCACGAAGVQRFAERVNWVGRNARTIDPVNYRRPRWVALIKRILP